MIIVMDNCMTSFSSKCSVVKHSHVIVHWILDLLIRQFCVCLVIGAHWNSRMTSFSSKCSVCMAFTSKYLWIVCLWSVVVMKLREVPKALATKLDLV
jgi:hypothetical protein